jgi:hypothetical protein
MLADRPGGPSARGRSRNDAGPPREAGREAVPAAPAGAGGRGADGRRDRTAGYGRTNVSKLSLLMDGLLPADGVPL